MTRQAFLAPALFPMQAQEHELNSTWSFSQAAPVSKLERLYTRPACVADSQEHSQNTRDIRQNQEKQGKENLYEELFEFQKALARLSPLR